MLIAYVIFVESHLAGRIRSADLIIWYEIVICTRYCVESLDRTLRVIMPNPFVPFGMNCILLRGNFRQILPVVPEGSREMIVHLCLKSSPLSEDLILLHLTKNMRLQYLIVDPKVDPHALNYPPYLLRVGEGKLKHDERAEIDLTPSINVVKSCSDLVNVIFENISSNYYKRNWLTSRAILVPTNNLLHDINNQVSQMFPGVLRTYLSADSVVCDDLEVQKSAELNYPQELLNSIDAGSSLPDHEINLKEAFIVMLLRNIRPQSGHVNGTRYILEIMTPNLLFLISFLVP